jgi:hypothetical protein
MAIEGETEAACLIWEALFDFGMPHFSPALRKVGIFTAELFTSGAGARTQRL